MPGENVELNPQYQMPPEQTEGSPTGMPGPGTVAAIAAAGLGTVLLFNAAWLAGAFYLGYRIRRG